MVKIISVENIEKNITCIGCSLINKAIKSPCETIFESKNFLVNQDYEVPIPGFVVLSTKRHIKGILDFNNNEEKEFYKLVKNIRLALSKALDIKYVMLFSNESKIISKRNPSHFHFCFLPKDGFESKTLNETLVYAKENMKTENNIKRVKESAIKLKKFLSKL